MRWLLAWVVVSVVLSPIIGYVLRVGSGDE